MRVYEFPALLVEVYLAHSLPLYVIPFLKSVIKKLEEKLSPESIEGKKKKNMGGLDEEIALFRRSPLSLSTIK